MLRSKAVLQEQVNLLCRLALLYCMPLVCVAREFVPKTLCQPSLAAPAAAAATTLGTPQGLHPAE
jgi:hypothetical protein